LCEADKEGLGVGGKTYKQTIPKQITKHTPTLKRFPNLQGLNKQKNPSFSVVDARNRSGAAQFSLWP
jgi:hypothetical protein